MQAEILRFASLSLIYVKRPLSSPPVNSKPILVLRAVDPRLLLLEDSRMTI